MGNLMYRHLSMLIPWTAAIDDRTIVNIISSANFTNLTKYTNPIQQDGEVLGNLITRTYTNTRVIVARQDK